MLLSEFDKHVINAKNDFLLGASNLKNNSSIKHFTRTVSARDTQYFSIHNIIICNSNLGRSRVVLCNESRSIGSKTPHRNFYIIQYEHSCYTYQAI